VRSILEYGSLVWDLHTANGFYHLERVQSCSPHDYTPVSKGLDLKSLANRRRMLGKTFLRVLLSNRIDSPTLLFLINFKVPQLSTRTPMSIYFPTLKLTI